MTIKEEIKHYFEHSSFMVDKVNLARIVKSKPSYVVRILKELREEGLIVRIRTAKKYFYQAK